MRKVIVGFFLTICVPAIASQALQDCHQGIPDRPYLELTRQAMAGDGASLQELKGCARNCSNCALNTAAVLRQAGRLNKAVEYYEQAVSLGNSHAPLGLVQIYGDLDDMVEAFAWSQFYLLSLHDVEEVLAGDAQGTLAFEVLLESARALDDNSAAQGEARAREILAKWQAVPKQAVKEPNQDQSAAASSSGLTHVRRTPPRFPREMAANPASPGWVVIDVEIRRDGQVNDVLAVDFSDRSFARSAERAARRWLFEVSDSVEWQTLTRTFIIEFVIKI